MDQGQQLVWVVVIGLGILAFKVFGWIRFSAQKNELDDRVKVARQSLAASDGSSAKVSVYRMPRYVGKLNLYYVYCDDQPIAGLKNGRFATVSVPAGEHVFTAPGTSAAPITLTLEPSQEVFIKCGPEGVAGFTFAQSDPKQARLEMAGLQSEA